MSDLGPVDTGPDTDPTDTDFTDADPAGLAPTDTDADAEARANRWWTVGAVVVFAVLVIVLAFVLGRRTSGPGTGEVDVGFLQDMTSHHEQAVQMSLIALERGSDQEAQGFAQENVMFQRWELGKMSAMLDERGLAPESNDPDRPVMRWMGMGGTLREMPGMASDADIEELRSLSGVEADLKYLELMREHHRGGLHMSEYAAEHADDERIRELAETMARNQRAEIAEYTRTIERLEAAQNG